MEKKIILGIALVFFSFALISALDISGGETKYIDLSGETETIFNITYNITGNSSNLDGLTISINDSIVEIHTEYWYKPDNFTITFTINGEYHVADPTGGGGSSGGSNTQTTCYKDYTCTDWSGCPTGYDYEVRVCQEIENCNLTLDKAKPIESKSCTPDVLEEPETPSEPKEEPIIDEVEKNNLLIKIILVVVIVIAFIIIFKYFKKVKKSKETKIHN